MRDPNRIDVYIELLTKIWKSYPDFRFGQMILNCGDLTYYDEDDVEFAKIFYMYKDHLSPEDKEKYRKYFADLNIRFED